MSINWRNIIQNGADEARQSVKVLDPALGVPLAPIHLALNCGLNNIKVNNAHLIYFMLILILQTVLWDVHVFTHAFGWFLAMVALRDVTFCWVCGIFWEFTETIFEQRISELKECWWDKVYSTPFVMDL